MRGELAALLAQQVSGATTSGRLRSLPPRSCGGALISRSIANSTSMRSTASIAIGALLMRARSKLAPRMRPARGLDDRPGFARCLVEPVESGIGVRLHQPGIAGQMLLGMLAAAVGRNEGTAGESAPPKG